VNKTDLGRVSCKLTRPILIAFKVKSQIILHQSPTALLRVATTKSKFSKAAPPIAPLIAPESAPSSKPSRNEPQLAIISKISFLKIQTQIYNKFWTYKLIRTRTLRIQVNCLFNKFKRLHHIFGARNTNDKSKITILIT